jgi:hypothetical protein
VTPKTTIWIAPRTDGNAGAGTRLNPLDGSGAERFDRLMVQRLRPDVRVHLIPWTPTNEKALFETTGSNTFNGAGFYLPPDCEIIGAGMDKVTVRKISHPETGGPAHGVFEMAEGNGGVRLEGMTIDQGGEALSGKATSTFAFLLRGSNNTTKNIHTINGYGCLKSGSEAFEMAYVPECRNGVWQISVGCSMDLLTESHFRGDYGIAIAPLPAPDGTGSVATHVRNCLVTGHKGTAPYGMCSHVRFSNCNAVGCRAGWYTEGGIDLHDIELEDCKILSPIEGIGLHFNPIGPNIISKALVERCYIETNRIGLCLSAEGPDHQGDYIVRKNVFVRVGGDEWTRGIVFAHVDGALIESNLSDPNLAHDLNDARWPSKNVICRRNGSLPAPKGLEDTP